MFYTRIYDSQTQKEGNKWFLSFTYAWSLPFEHDQTMIWSGKKPKLYN